MRIGSAFLQPDVSRVQLRGPSVSAGLVSCNVLGGVVDACSKGDDGRYLLARRGPSVSVAPAWAAGVLFVLMSFAVIDQ